MSHAHKHVAPSITPKRWQYLKGLGLSDGRYIHVSARTKADRRVPLRPRGVTYNVGRNQAKREKCEQARVDRAELVSLRGFNSQRARGVA